jgi:hypothetical protein
MARRATLAVLVHVQNSYAISSRELT